MKKVLFAPPILILVLFLAYCAKESVKPTAATSPDRAKSETIVADRDGGKSCTVNITTSGTVRVCGLSTNGTTCYDCYSVARSGFETGTSFSYTLVPTYPDVPFSITNITNGTITVQIQTSASCGVWTLTSGQCAQFGLSTTCLMFSSIPFDTCH